MKIKVNKHDPKMRSVSEYAQSCLTLITGREPDSGVFKAPNGKYYALDYREGRAVEDGYVYRALNLGDHTIEDFNAESLITPVAASITIKDPE